MHSFADLKAHPDFGRAEALRSSMVELIQHCSLEYAHPAMMGAPFVLVGEGAEIIYAVGPPAEASAASAVATVFNDQLPN